MSSLEFKAVLLDISNQLTADQLAQIKFLCQDIGKRELEKIDTGRKLFQVLTERGRLGEDNTEHVIQLLQHIQRPDLADKIRHFENQRECGHTPLAEAEEAKLRIATEVIAENLGRSWRKLGRKLGLTDVKLESISKRHPTELEETAVELLKEWKRSRGSEARTEEVIAALRACQLNLTADKVQHRMAAEGY